MDERSALQGALATALGQNLPRGAPQFVIDERDQFLSRRALAFAPLLK